MADRHYQVDVRTGTITIPTSDTVTKGTNTEILNGECRWVEFTTPAMEDTDSTLLEIITSERGGTIFSSGTKAESTTSQAGTIFPLYGTMKIVATAEGTQSAAVKVGYTIYYVN